MELIILTLKEVLVCLYIKILRIILKNLDQAAARFNLQELGNIYSRIGNPTSDVLGQRLANVEGGAFGIPVSSGMAACFYALVNLASSGDNVAYSNKIYGGTQTLISHTLKNFGIEARELISMI